MKKLLLSFTFICFSIVILAQGKSTQETVDYINGKSGGNFTVTVKKDREMSIEFFKGGELYRTDEFYLGTLNPEKTEYSTEEGAIILRCYEEVPKEFKKLAGDCIMRELHKTGKRAYYNRALIMYKGDKKSQDGLIKAFNHLIRISQDEGEYQYIEEFE